MENKVSNMWKSFLPSIVVFALQLAFSYIGMFLVFCLQAHYYTGGGFKKFIQSYYKVVTSTDFNVLVMLVYAVIATVLFSLWYYKKVRDKEKDQPAFAAFQKQPLYFVAGALLLAFGMQYLCTYLSNVVAMLFPDWLSTYEALMDGMGMSDGLTVPLILYTIILGPICEELAFRGLTFTYARRAMNFWGANVVQAFLFAAMHMNPLQAVYTFLFGLVLGYFVEKAGNLSIGICLHICFNAVGVLSGGLAMGGNGPVQFFCILFGSMVATYLGFLLLKRCVTKEENN